MIRQSVPPGGVGSILPVSRRLLTFSSIFSSVYFLRRLSLVGQIYPTKNNLENMLVSTMASGLPYIPISPD